MADPRALAALAATRSSGPTLTRLPPTGPQGGSGDVQAMLARLQQARANKPRLDLSVARAKPKSHAKPRGLLSQIRDAVVSLPKGVAMLGGMALGESRNVLSGKTGVLGAVRAATGDIAPEQYEAANPLTATSARSMINTGMDIRHPTRFQQAVREGTIVDKLIEDAANASIVVGGAGQAAHAAGLTGLGAGLERAAALGGGVANAPISLPRAGLTALTERGLPSLGRLPVGAIDEALGRRRTLGENFPTTFTEHGRQAKQFIKGESRRADRAAAAMSRTGFKESTMREKLGGNPTAAEEAAATAIQTGQADVGRLAAHRGAAPEAIQRTLAPQNVPESHLTPEAAQIAQEFLADPAAHPRVQRLLDVRRGIAEKNTREALSTETGRQAALEPEQVTSHEPLPRKVDEFNATWDKQIADAREFNPGLGRELEGERAAAFEQFLDNPDNYPARWRDRMVEAQQLAAGGADVPTRPPELAAAGILPEYLPSGRSRLTLPKASKQEMIAATEGVSGDIRLTSEKVKGTRGHYGLYSNRALFDRWADEARQGVLNKAYRTLTDTEGQFATSPAKVLGPDVMDQINRDAVDQATSMHPGGGDVSLEADRLRGDAIRQAMREQGYEAWATTGDALSPIPASQIKADSPFLHAGMKTRLAKQWTTKELPLPAKALEAINRKFKGAVLPWSLRWQVGDATSNALLAWVAGEVNPIDLVNSMRKLKRLTPEEEALLDARVQDVGLTNSEREWQHALPARENARFREHPIRALQRPGYKLNSTINRVERHAFYLEKLDRLLGEEGMTLQEAGRQVEAGVETPKVTAAIDKAVDQANDVMGAFDEMSPFERRWMRNVFPFYPWMRHITKLTARLAIDDPVRAMWVMRVGSVGVDPDSEMPGYLRGAIHTPVGTFDTNFLNPFADPTSSSPLTPEGAMRSLSPGFKLGAAALTGADLNRGGLQLSRPFDTSRRDEFGRQGFNPLALPGRLDELGYLISQQIPQTRMLVNLAPKVKVGDVNLGPVARYGQGTMLRRGKSDQPLHEDPRTEALGSLLSIPIPKTDKEIAEMLRSIRKRKKGG